MKMNILLIILVLLTCIVLSGCGTTVKEEGKPMVWAYSLRKRINTEWKVPIHRRRALRSPTIRAIRSFISPAAFFVKVSARIRSGSTPFSIKYAMREVSTRVLPEPAPATISMGPSIHVTALSCSSFKASRISLISSQNSRRN